VRIIGGMTGKDAGRDRLLWDLLLGVGLALWLGGFVWHWSRPSLWILDLLVVPVAAVLYWFGFVAVVFAVIAGRRWVTVMTLVPVLVILTILVNPMWRVAPRTWFMLHRPLFNVALETDPGPDYYGNKLPLPLRFLTADGRVSDEEQNGSRFFAQWFGIPDDAGGYVYSPGKSPEGASLYGLFCRGPVDLGGGWWMCGLADTGF
jgi:hypothetical protein